ncbi:MAG: hypothetical protein PUA71_05715 [Eubacteriales bacterium]|nr:hypothetical protein [Eubacteriales bacterium]
MENKPNENVNKNKIKYIVGIILIGFIAIIAAGLENEIRNKPKDGKGTGMFEKFEENNCVYCWKKVKEFKGSNKDKIADKLKNYNWTGGEENINVSKTDFNIVFDFNNDWCKLYMRKEDKKCILNDSEHELSDDIYDYLISKIDEK